MNGGALCCVGVVCGCCVFGGVVGWTRAQHVCVVCVRAVHISLSLSIYLTETHTNTHHTHNRAHPLHRWKRYFLSLSPLSVRTGLSQPVVNPNDQTRESTRVSTFVCPYRTFNYNCRLDAQVFHQTATAYTHTTSWNFGTSLQLTALFGVGFLGNGGLAGPTFQVLFVCLFLFIFFGDACCVCFVCSPLPCCATHPLSRPKQPQTNKQQFQFQYTAADATTTASSSQVTTVNSEEVTRGSAATRGWGCGGARRRRRRRSRPTHTTLPLSPAPTPLKRQKKTKQKADGR